MGERQEGVERCPAGCDFDELELGTESESFMAALTAPYQHIRCAKCGFNADRHSGLANSREGAVEKWNAAALAATGKGSA